MIPRVFHYVWVGGDLPKQHRKWMDDNMRLHAGDPTWEMRLWTDSDVDQFKTAGMIKEARRPAQKADIMRIEIVYEHGGVYLDTDTEVLRRFDPLLGDEAFAGLQQENYLCTTPLGAVPKSAFFSKLMGALETRKVNGDILKQTANTFVTEFWLANQDLPLAVYPTHCFCPYLWWDKPPLAYSPETFCVHHWNQSWV